jgi:hypothetical protein
LMAATDLGIKSLLKAGRQFALIFKTVPGF